MLQIARLIRGSKDRHILDLNTLVGPSYGLGKHLHHTEEECRVCIRQAWLKGLLEREITLGGGKNMIGNIAFASYAITPAGHSFLSEPSAVCLPVTSQQIDSEDSQSTLTSHVPKSHQAKARQGQGSHVLPLTVKLIANDENWFDIESSDNYHFPGVFHHEYPKRLGFCSDITQLMNYESTDMHFLFADIQLGKGKGM